MTPAPFRAAQGGGVRRALYLALSLVVLMALLNTGWARLGPLGFGLTLCAFLTGRLINRPWLLADWRAGRGAGPLSQELAGQTLLALSLFWIGFCLSHLTNWSPEFAVGRPAGVILVVAGLRRWLFPPRARRDQSAALRALNDALAVVPPEAVTRHRLAEILARARDGLPPDAYVIQLIDRAEATASSSDRLAMVLAVTEPEQAVIGAGRHDLARAFDLLRDGRDGEALLTFAVRAAALLEDIPGVLGDLPSVEHLHRTAEATPSPAAAAGLRALADRIERQKNEMYSL